jgi:outer membrane protein OmpA-like peptidoglycan-associated protein
MISILRRFILINAFDHKGDKNGAMVKLRNKFVTAAIYVGLLMATNACMTSSTPVEGPDKVFVGEAQGAMAGAGAGAITGAQLTAGAGPGALVGAGLGAVAGGIQGFAEDSREEKMMAMAAESQQARAVAYAQQVLSEHYARRAELYPSRDIFPADIFFRGDETKLRPSAIPVIAELAQLNKDRLAWSRLTIAAYIKSADENSVYAQRLADRRARSISNAMVRYGIEPRRLQTRGVVISAPLVIDPQDDPLRYSQAIELIALDK